MYICVLIIKTRFIRSQKHKMFYELMIAIVSSAFSFLLYFSFHNFFRTIFYRRDKIRFDERHDLIDKELLFVSVVRMAIHLYLNRCICGEAFQKKLGLYGFDLVYNKKDMHRENYFTKNAKKRTIPVA